VRLARADRIQVRNGRPPLLVIGQWDLYHSSCTSFQLLPLTSSVEGSANINGYDTVVSGVGAQVGASSGVIPGTSGGVIPGTPAHPHRAQQELGITNSTSSAAAAVHVVG
jgi:hypothetical protein